MLILGRVCAPYFLLLDRWASLVIKSAHLEDEEDAQKKKSVHDLEGDSHKKTTEALWRIFISYYGIMATAGDFKARGSQLFSDFTVGISKLATIFDMFFTPVMCAKVPYLLVWIVKAVAPYAFIIMVGAGVPCYIKWKRRKKTLTAAQMADDLPLRSRLVGTLIFVMYYLFPSTVVGLLKGFYCTNEIHEGKEESGGPRYLMTDLSVQCFSGEHLATVLPAVVLLLFYTVCVPGAIMAITKFKRSKLYTKKYLTMYGFLYNGFREGCEWWEVLVMFRKVTIAVILVYFTDPFMQSFSSAFVLLISLYFHTDFKARTSPTADCSR